MISKIFSFLSSILGFVFSSAIPKFFLFFALYFLVLEFVPVLAEWVGADKLISSLSSSLNSIPSEALYFIGFLKIGFGLKMICGAYILRFIIRRVPIIG